MKTEVDRKKLLKKAKQEMWDLAQQRTLTDVAEHIRYLMSKWIPTYKKTKRTVGELIRIPKLDRVAVDSFKKFKKELDHVHQVLMSSSGKDGRTGDFFLF